MYFKQIEMTGFKSFADKTALNLEPGITAIVGPNGCGKSNILDALRWSLGEQRAKVLRGSHMQDVIFNGTDERQPMGMAEVSLTFDNSDSVLPVDFAEVQVTRRLYRSGESEYLLNKTPCRLRDIQELFMDTGIGTSAYSLIGQGQISMVLSSKPEDRRFLFEEAAGITKYKTRKRIALRKLDSADQNLLRLGDIVAEIQRQMRSLKRQVNAAIRYRELSAELKDVEIRANWLKFHELDKTVVALRKQFAEAQNAYEQTNAQLSQHEARHEKLGLDKLETERVLLVRRDGVYTIDSEMEKVERQIALLKQQIDFSKEQEQRAQNEDKELQKRAEELLGQIAATQEKATGLKARVEECNDEISAKQSDYEQCIRSVEDADSALESLRKDAVETINNRAKTQTELDTVSVNITNIDNQLSTLYERQNSENERHEELTAQVLERRKIETDKQTELSSLDSERESLKSAEEQKSVEMRNLNEEWQNAREKKSSSEARLNSLRELRDAYEGFAVGVRAVMIAKREMPDEVQGIIGPVGDLLSTDKKYEHAMEAALGGNINNVVSEDADSAKAAIDFLRRNRAGRVTFLPLDIIRSTRKDVGGELANRRGVIGPAISFAQYDAHISNAVEYLLRGTLIVETLDDAIEIAKQERSFPRLVTLEGEVVASSGAVTGGRTKHESRGLLGRSAEIDELEGVLKKAGEEIADMAQRGAALTQELKDTADKLRDLAVRTGALREELRELGIDIARMATELESLSQSATNLESGRDELCEKRSLLEEQRRAASERVESMESEDETLQRKTAEAQEAASKQRESLSVCASQLADLRIKLAGLSQGLEELERDKQREQREHENTLQEAKQRMQDYEQAGEKQKELQSQIDLQIEGSKAMSENKAEAKKKVVEAENKNATTSAEMEEVEKNLRQLREAGRKSQSDVHKLEIDLRHDEDQIEFFQERMMSEYQITLASLSADDVGTDEYEDKERSDLVEQLRNRLQRMGQVNLMAIEEYEALEKRNEFLVTQETDLNEARTALLDVVARIDVRIEEMFLETFNNIRQTFHEIFRRLFNGGQARIYLLDEDDPLESGIEIEARPPGKKPQTISLLSGGEKAMTAIALLFSIFKAKPSPFCVLDEVDAPLDDANIGRFLDMITEFTDKSQFVVITHNKQTMACAEALYGVTMMERGVSQLVSVRIEEADKVAGVA